MTPVRKRICLLICTIKIVHFSIILKEVCHLGALFAKQFSSRKATFCMGNHVLVSTDSTVPLLTAAAVPIQGQMYPPLYS